MRRSPAGITAVILAGGLGTRLRDTVPDVPKPMAPIGGRPFLEHLLDYWVEQGIGRVVLSAGYRHETITNHFGAVYRGIAIQHVVESQPLGTGGGLMLALNFIRNESRVLVLNGDTFFQVSLAGLTDFHLSASSHFTLCMYPSAAQDRYLSLEVGGDGRIHSLTGNSSTGPSFINGGVYMVEVTALAAGPWSPGQSASIENDILPGLIGAGHKVFGYESSGTFIDIGLPRDYSRAGEILPRGA